MLAYHGLRNSVVDVVFDVRERLYAPPRRRKAEADRPDWVTVLYHGTATTGEATDVAASAQALAAIDEERGGRARDILLDTSGAALAAPRDAAEDAAEREPAPRTASKESEETVACRPRRGTPS